MKKVLVIYYSQTGQLKSVVESFISQLPDDKIQVDIREIQGVEQYPYPWGFYQFADEFVEAALVEGAPVNPIQDIEDDYDLIILGYTIWFLSPSSPIVGFLKSEQAKKIFKNKPVITLIACRDMWVMAQEKMKDLLNNLNAILIDNVALTDQGKGVYSLITTPKWLMSGKKDAFWFFPPAGILQSDIDAASRFGERLNAQLKLDKEKELKPLLSNLGAVNIDGKLIGLEIIATRSSKIWAKFVKLFGKKKSLGRKIGMSFYIGFLVLLVFTIMPINLIVRKIINKFRKNKLRDLERKYERPSGR